MSTEAKTSKKRGAAAMEAGSSSGGFGIELAKAIDRACKSQGDFKKAVDTLETLMKDGFSDIEMKHRAKKLQLDELGADFERNKREKRIELEQDFQQYGMKQAERFLQEKQLLAVGKEEFAKLQQQVEQLREGRDQAIQQALTDAQNRFDQELERTKMTLQLKNQAEVAEKQAQITQLQNHIKVLDRVINDQKLDVSELRKLVSEVSGARTTAMANSSAPSGSSLSSSSSQRSSGRNNNVHD